MKVFNKNIFCIISITLLLLGLLTSCASVKDNGEDAWQQQWKKLVIEREKDIVCIKYEYVSDISEDKEEDKRSYDERVYSKEDIEKILSAISAAGAEFEQIDIHTLKWYDLTKSGCIRLKIISDMQPNYLYTKNGEAPNFYNIPTERVFADESNSGYAYAIKVYVKGNGVFIETDAGYYVSKGKPDYEALTDLLNN